MKKYLIKLKDVYPGLNYELKEDEIIIKFNKYRDAFKFVNKIKDENKFSKLNFVHIHKNIYVTDKLLLTVEQMSLLLKEGNIIQGSFERESKSKNGYVHIKNNNCKVSAEIYYNKALLFIDTPYKKEAESALLELGLPVDISYQSEDSISIEVQYFKGWHWKN